MSHYRRALVPGGCFFFTVVTENRAPLFCDERARALLHESIDRCRAERPFELVAIVLLPDHLHAIWSLPDGDADFSTRWAAIKARFTHAYLAEGGREQQTSDSRVGHRRRGVWQRKFWEHRIRDEADLRRHLDYVHYNPVKHGHASCPHAWPHSSFHRHVRNGTYAIDWGCQCDARTPEPIRFDGLDTSAME